MVNNDTYCDVSNCLENLIMNGYLIPETDSEISVAASDMIDTTDLFISTEHDVVVLAIKTWLHNNKSKVRRINKYVNYISNIPLSDVVNASCPHCHYIIGAKGYKDITAFTIKSQCPACNETIIKTIGATMSITRHP